MLLEKSQKNKFTLHLHKSLYNERILDRLIKEDKTWIRLLKSGKDHHLLEFKTSCLNDVLEWANYLFYLNKTA